MIDDVPDELREQIVVALREAGAIVRTASSSRGCAVVDELRVLTGLGDLSDLDAFLRRVAEWLPDA